MSKEGIEYLVHEDFKTESGTILNLKTAYRTFGDKANTKAIIVPTCFAGKINDTLSLVGNGETNPLDDNYFVIVVGLLGAGESSSPSNQEEPNNGPNFPAITHSDNVKSQVLLCKHLGIKQLYAVVGFSMAGQVAYHFGILYPDFVKNLVILASSAETSDHNLAFLEGPKAALVSSEGFNNGYYTAGEARKGKTAFGRVYCPWALSAQWFKEKKWIDAGAESMEAYFVKNWDAMANEDANDLLSNLQTWQTSSIARYHPSKDLYKTLASMKPRCLVMPVSTDRYFRVEDSEEEIKHLPSSTSKLSIIKSIWGHVAGGGGGPKEDDAFITKEIKKWFAELPAINELSLTA